MTPWKRAMYLEIERHFREFARLVAEHPEFRAELVAGEFGSAIAAADTFDPDTLAAMLRRRAFS